MKKYSIIGAGELGQKAIELLKRENVNGVYDNDSKKWGNFLCGLVVEEVPKKGDGLLDTICVIAVSQKYHEAIRLQLLEIGIENIVTIQEIIIEKTREKILSRKDYISLYNRAINWIMEHSVDAEGIIGNTKQNLSYPEVTGYFIPTLIRWGYKDLAIQYAIWLCSIQKEDGSWYDSLNQDPYIFDSAQILKGLIAIYPYMSEVKTNIIKGCKWIVSCMNKEGKLVTPVKTAWGRPGMCSELIHLYCLSPLIEASKMFDMPELEDAAKKCLDYYKENHYDEIMEFHCLSHFYAYITEALVDLGEVEMATAAMEKIAKQQRENGWVPAYSNVDWVCSTGLFQLALVWFRLGEVERGNAAFKYACDLQNESGGWYGSYLTEESTTETNNDYFPFAEISWAVKYFLYGLSYKGIAEFNNMADSFLENIESEDGRFKLIDNLVKNSGKNCKVLDAGCGKGRYLQKLLKDYPESKYCGIDISEKVLEFCAGLRVETKVGNLTNIPYEDCVFDLVYACESLEHAIDIRSAVAEMARVTKKGGKIVVIDKNNDSYGRLELCDWEVWFGIEELKTIMLDYCSEVQIIDKIDYENKKNDSLFTAWIGVVK